ncbi:MAG: ATP-binding protein [bacterium]|nr:ATP-binding protein [bacterium]
MVEELQRITIKHIIHKDLAKTKSVYGDRDRIGQVITNLLTNAIKYSPHANRIVVRTSTDKKTITLCVEDFGIGISKEQQSHVFERFYRVSGPKEDTFPGLGIGLYISIEIIKRQGGRIWVESVKGEGSTFCFRIPMKIEKLIKS